jgi:hypothetical protein
MRTTTLTKDVQLQKCWGTLHSALQHHGVNSKAHEDALGNLLKHMKTLSSLGNSSYFSVEV